MNLWIVKWQKKEDYFYFICCLLLELLYNVCHIFRSNKKKIVQNSKFNSTIFVQQLNWFKWDAEVMETNKTPTIDVFFWKESIGKDLCHIRWIKLKKKTKWTFIINTCFIAASYSNSCIWFFLVFLFSLFFLIFFYDNLEW